MRNKKNVLRGLLPPSYANSTPYNKWSNVMWPLWYSKGQEKYHKTMTVIFIQYEWLQLVIAWGQTLRQGPCSRIPHHTHLWLNPPGCVQGMLFSGSKGGEQKTKWATLEKSSAVKMWLGLTGELGKVKYKIKMQKYKA